MPVEGKDEYYHIIQDPASKCPPGLAQVEGSINVILSSEPGEWRIEKLLVDIPDGDVYQSVPLSNFTFVSGTNFLH